jgi:hypothetical protein
MPTSLCSAYVNNGGGDGIPSSPSAYETSLYSLVNEFRSGKGWVSWEWDSNLHKAAHDYVRNCQQLSSAGQKPPFAVREKFDNDAIKLAEYYGYHSEGGTNAVRTAFAKILDDTPEFMFERSEKGFGLVTMLQEWPGYIDAAFAHFEGCWALVIATGNSCEESDPPPTGGGIDGPVTTTPITTTPVTVAPVGGGATAPDLGGVDPVAPVTPGPPRRPCCCSFYFPSYPMGFCNRCGGACPANYKLYC